MMNDSMRAIRGRAAEARCALLERTPELATVVEQYPPAIFIAAFEKADRFLGYNHVPPAARSRMNDIERHEGSAAAADYLAYVLISLIEDFDKRFAAAKLPDIFAERFTECFANLMDRVLGMDGWSAVLDNDVFLKDLGICRLTLIPCVSHLLYRWSGMPRRVLLRQPLGTLPETLYFFLAKTRGFKPFMEHHVHLPMRHNFNPEGRERFYTLAATLLRLWPETKGLMAGSWYFDPVVETISPRLAYLRQVPERHGAIFLKGGTDRNVIGSALSKSQTRRQLYEDGKYMPTSYFMVWARQDILKVYG